MYSLIRLLMGLLFLAGLGLLSRRFVRKQKRLWSVVALVGVVVLVACAGMVPFENTFMTFDSPEAVFHYYTPGKENVMPVAEGKESALVIGRNGSAMEYLIVPKAGTGWEIATGKDTRLVLQYPHDELLVSIYQYADSNDRYAVIHMLRGGETAVVDDLGTDFFRISTYDSALGRDRVTYCAVVPADVKIWTIHANGAEIALTLET